MNTPINDGGPVYPTTSIAEKDGDNIKFNVQPGISVRDWFAGQALMGILVNSKASDPSQVPEMLNAVTKYRYLTADAMIAARKNQGGTIL